MDAREFVRTTGQEPLRPGHNDCANWGASLVAARTGRDPAEGFRGKYSTVWQGRQILMRHGGLLTLARRQMAWLPAGGDGDGVCVARVRRTTVAGVMSDGRLWLKSDCGVVSPDDYAILERWVL